MNNEKDAVLMLEGKEGRREGERLERRKDGRGKQRIAFLARYKQEAKFARKFYIYPSHVPNSFKVLAAIPSY